MKTTSESRFDTRLSKKQKEFFEYAATLGGYRSLTDFIISSVQQAADSIVEKNEAILASKQDRELFFDALMHPPKPGSRLKKAAGRYMALTGE